MKTIVHLGTNMQKKSFRSIVAISIIAGFGLLFSEALNAQTSVGSSETYTTLAEAFTAINDGTLTGDVVLEITSSISDNNTATLNANGSGSADYSSVTIYPTGSGYTLSGNINGPIIDFDGADNVTIDGRVNASGSTIDMEIQNSNGWQDDPSVVRLINSAENNTIQYCDLISIGESSSEGVIFFSTSSSGNGNDGNTINQCSFSNLFSDYPKNVIYSEGTLGSENSSNTIEDCYFYNHFGQSDDYRGIHLSSNSSDWTISGNHFYQTGTPSGGAYSYSSIYINNTSGNNFTIENNYIGGSQASCGGSAFSLSAGGSALNYTGIYLNVDNTTASSIQNNTIANFSISGQSANPWTGIRVEAGAVNIGTVSGNTIGSNTGTGSIISNCQSINADSYGISVISTDNVNVLNNAIGSITTTAGGLTNSHSFHSIHKNNAGDITISNNTIGSIATANSINTSNSNTDENQWVTGIYNEGGTGTITISNNTIANITNASVSGTNDPVDISIAAGIYSGAGINTISDNTIHDITNSSTYQWTSNFGIYLENAAENHTVSGNMIHSITTTGSGGAEGIAFYGSNTSGTSDISDNFIYNLSLLSANTTNTPAISGIYVSNGVYGMSNNLIVLTPDCPAYVVNGIYSYNTTAIDVFFNTVYIGGSVTSGDEDSYGINNREDADPGAIRDYRNNIFMNTRTGAGDHYALGMNRITTLTLDYNDYYSNDTYLAYYQWVQCTDLTALIAESGQDANSSEADPVFDNEGGTNKTDWVKSTTLNAATGTGVLKDITGYTRSATLPQMGAIERSTFLEWLGTSNTAWETDANWSSGTAPISTDEVYIEDKINNPVISTDVVVTDLSIDGSGVLTLASNGTLEVTGNLTNDVGTAGIYINSDDSNTGSLIHSSSGIGASVESYMISNRWHIASAPVSGQDRPTFLSNTTNSIPTSGSNYGMMYYDESSGWVYYTTSNNTGNITLGSGFLLRTSTEDPILYEGTLTSSTETATLTRAGFGWNCVGNPYTAAIGANSAATTSDDFLSYNADQLNPSFAAIYLWDEPATKVSEVSYYTLLNSTDPETYLQAGQGFILKAKDGGGTATFTADMRKHETATTFVKKSSQTLRKEISLIVNAEDKVANTRILFMDGMTKGLDVTYDGGLLGGDPSFKLYSQLVEDNGVDFMVQCLPNPDENGFVIPLGFDCKTSAEVTFSADFSNFDESYTLKLEDRTLNTFTDFNSEENTYLVDGLNNNSDYGRFYLHVAAKASSLKEDLSYKTKIYQSDSHLFIESELDELNINIYDIQGKKIWQKQNVEAGNSSIDLSFIQRGVYIVVAEREGTCIKTEKIIF